MAWHPRNSLRLIVRAAGKRFDPTVSGDPLQPRPRVEIAAPTKPQPIGERHDERLSHEMIDVSGSYVRLMTSPNILSLGGIQTCDGVGIERHPDRTTLHGD